MIAFIFLLKACLIESYAEIHVTDNWNSVIKNSDCPLVLQQKFIENIKEKSTKLPHKYLENILGNDVQITPEIINVTPLEAFLLEICKTNDLKLSKIRSLNGEVVGNNFKCKVFPKYLLLEGSNNSNYKISYSSLESKEMLVYVKDINKDEMLKGKTDCKQGYLNKNEAYISCDKKEGLAFCKAIKNKKANSKVMSNDCISATIVERNKIINLVFSKNQLQLITSGKAKESGKFGEMITVERAGNNLSGKVIDFNKVLVQL